MITVSFGTRLLLMALTSLAPALMMPVALAVAADHEAVHVLQEDDRQPVLVAVHDEAGGLLGAVDVEHAAELERPVGRPHAMVLIGDDADRETRRSAPCRRPASGRTRPCTRRSCRRRRGRRARRGLRIRRADWG